MSHLRCEMNAADLAGDGPEGYVRCNRPANWAIQDGTGCWLTCEEHSLRALREGRDEVADLDGDAVTLENEEIQRRAS